MHRFIYRDLDRFAVWSRGESPTGPQPRALGHTQTALPFLRRFSGDPYNMDALREALTQDNPCPCAKKYNDEEILKQVAWRLTEHTLFLAEQPYNTLPRGAAREASSLASAPATPPPAPTAEPIEPEPALAPEPEPIDEENVDAAVQAATLESAAETGVPFCEECEKARHTQENAASMA